MWNVKVEVTPAITGTISKSLRQYLSNITGNTKLKNCKKQPYKGTAHILQKVLT
jgi:hypothetical protein